MPNIYTAADICEQALRTVGETPPHDQPTSEVLKISLKTLDMMMSNFAGSKEITGYWTTIEVPITANNASVVLSPYLPDNGMQFVYSAKLRENSNLEIEDVKLIGEEEYNGLDADETGTPYKAYIDRSRSPTMYIYPILGSDVAAGTYTVLLQIQTYDVDINTAGTGRENLSLRDAWNLWAVTKLAYLIGRGPVCRLPENELTRLQRDYLLMEADLMTHDNNETENEPVTQPWGA